MEILKRKYTVNHQTTKAGDNNFKNPLLTSSPDGCYPFNAVFNVQFIKSVAVSDLNCYVPLQVIFETDYSNTSAEARHKGLIIIAGIYIIQSPK